MSEEIYLSNLDWVNTHDNMGGVIGHIIFKNAMTHEKFEKIISKSYLLLEKGQQEEIERLNKGYCQFKKECGNVADCMREEYFQMQQKNMKMSVENDRLKKIINYKKQDIKKLKYELMYEKSETKSLNNIINELEKWFEERLEKLDILGYDEAVFSGIEIAKGKLQKLKENK